MNQTDRRGNAGPGGRLWLLKWLLVAALAVLVLLLLLGGVPGSASS